MVDQAISLQQPWAWLVVHADEYPDPKRIENRTWPTAVRGRVKIHASKTFDLDGYRSVIARRPDLANLLPQPNEFELGGIVGEVTIVDCVSQSDDEWFVGTYGFVLADPKPLPFFQIPGKLRFFEVPGASRIGGNGRPIDPRQMSLF